MFVRWDNLSASLEDPQRPLPKLGGDSVVRTFDAPEALGIRFVASPRHADLLLVTGPVSRHMELALRRTYDATPEPKLVVAIGECACNGGIYGESYATVGRVANVIPVDVCVPGCPPTPFAIMQGILTAISPGEG